MNALPEYFYFMIPVLLFLSAFFSGSETALFSIGKTDLFRMSSGSSRDRKIYKLLLSPEKLLVTLLLCNLIVNITISTVITEICLNISESYGQYFAMMIATPLIIMFGEIIPKIIAINNSGVISKIVVNPLIFFHAVIYPVRCVILLFMKGMIKILKINFSDTVNITESELDAALDVGKSDGALEAAESRFIKNILKLSKKTAQSIMIPRNEITVIEYGSSIEEAADLFAKKKFMRIPVFKDNIDNIKGFIDYRAILPYTYGMKNSKNINRLMIPAIHYPYSKELSSLLDSFIEKRIQMAVIVDEYGGTMGIVTLSSIIAEVMGENFTLSRDEVKTEIRIIDGISVITGDMQLVDFNEAFGEYISSDESETIAGFIIEKLERLPVKGDIITIENHILKVRSVRKNRIESIEVTDGNDDYRL